MRSGTMTWRSSQTCSDRPQLGGARSGGAVPAARCRGAGAAAAAQPQPIATAAAAAAAASSHSSSSRWSSAAHCARWCRARRPWQPPSAQQPQPRQRALPAAAAAPGSGSGGQQGETLADVMGSIFQQLMAMQGQPQQRPSGAHLHVDRLCYQPPGAAAPLLTDVGMTLPPNQLGLVFGRSGAGKTTLLQLVAGLAQQTSGSISFSGPPPAAPPAAQGGAPAAAAAAAAQAPSRGSSGLSTEDRMAQAGLVFQFPERHFIGRSMSAELTVGWPLAPEQVMERQALAARTHQVLAAVGLEALPLDVPLAHLSDGYKRRVALAVQLVRRPRLLLLDEPLAGLDWRTRAELIALLAQLKAECTMLVVSHDLRELAPLVDAAWQMQPGGRLEPSSPDRLPSLAAG